MSSSELPIMYIHGMDSSSQGQKALLLQGIFGDRILIPNFTNNVSERLALLDELIGQSTTKWILIGSSLGGLTATLYAIRHPEKVAKMILIAPALVPPYTHKYGLKPIKDIPVILYHGKDDELLSVEEVRKVAEKLFPLLDYHLVDDDHRMEAVTPTLDWESIVFL